MITVHHLNFSRSLRIVWLLEELGLDYEVVRYERDPDTRLAPPDLRQVHPLGKAPVIEMDGRIIAESGAIVEHICARHAPQMIPAAGSVAHIHHLELMHFAEGSLMTPLLLDIYVGILGAAGAPLHPRINQEIANHFGFLEGDIRPSGHFVLDTLSAVDVMLVFPCAAILRMGLEDRYGKLAAFVRAMQARPAFARAVAAAGGD